ncbi:MAG: hypothetical protein KatS3mg002_0676 [Candidatus Woesearchaeota archaeon]|nr:MAG: hypothetical protein KatS3mg002_0676 [Candidatus Woesearchaeota archaeon]
MAIDAVNSGRYYSAASYCFGGNVKILTEMYENVSKRKLKQEYAKLLGEISVKEYSIDEREIKTIADLETYMIVKETYRRC